MNYIYFLKKNQFYLNVLITDLLISQINLNSMLKFKKLKNFSRVNLNKKKIALLKTVLNKKKYNKIYENFNR